METSAEIVSLAQPGTNARWYQLGGRISTDKKKAWCVPPKNWSTTPHCCDCLGVGTLRCLCDGGDSRNFESRFIVRICTPAFACSSLTGTPARGNPCPKIMQGQNVSASRPEECHFLGRKGPRLRRGPTGASEFATAGFLEDRWYLRDQELRRNLAEAALPQAVRRA